MKKIVFSDYDGTLYTDDKTMFKNICTIEKFRKNGNKFVIATGRSYPSLERQLRKFKIPYDYLILNHGAIILDSNNKIISLNPIYHDTVEDILTLYEIRKNLYEIVLYGPFNEYVSSETNDIVKIIIKVQIHEEAVNLSCLINEYYKAKIRSYVIESKDRYLVEIVSAEVNKSYAIKKVLEIEKINSRNVFTIGDGTNDVEMIQEYNGYGMEKSSEIIYKVAHQFYRSVYELIEDILKHN